MSDLCDSLGLDDKCADADLWLVAESNGGCCCFMEIIVSGDGSFLFDRECNVEANGRVCKATAGGLIANCCQATAVVKLNGQTPPVTLEDGDPVDVTIEGCGKPELCAVWCESASALRFQKLKNGKTVLKVDRRGLLNKIFSIAIGKEKLKQLQPMPSTFSLIPGETIENSPTEADWSPVIDDNFRKLIQDENGDWMVTLLNNDVVPAIPFAKYINTFFPQYKMGLSLEEFLALPIDIRNVLNTAWLSDEMAKYVTKMF
jgi:hypothetical protein